MTATVTFPYFQKTKRRKLKEECLKVYRKYADITFLEQKKEDVLKVMEPTKLNKESETVWCYHFGFISNIWTLRELAVYIVFDSNDSVIYQYKTY